MTRPVPARAYPLRGQHGRVVHTLGMRIAGGDLAPGEPLPTEEELVGELDVGRSALREAMKRRLVEGVRDDLRFYAGTAET
jgi:GntR family transcriptional regulator, galactonate operon transcriptional repressor